VRAPKFDVGKLMELHGASGGEEVGKKVERTEDKESDDADAMEEVRIGRVLKY